MTGRQSARREASELLARTLELVQEFVGSLPERHVGATADAGQLIEALDGRMPEEGVPARQVIKDLARDADAGLVASAGPRYFGFVVGGALPASLAADWLTAAWDQNAALHPLSPAAAAAEHVAGEWMKELLGLPAEASVGLPTGAGLGNAVGLAAARRAVLGRVGWDVEARAVRRTRAGDPHRRRGPRHGAHRPPVSRPRSRTRAAHVVNLTSGSILD